MPVYQQKIEGKSDKKPLQKKGKGIALSQLNDDRPEAVAQKQVQKVISNSPQLQRAAQLQSIVNARNIPPSPIQKKENRTGLPDNLKAGIENLSGHSMDDVKVHFNSSKPSQLNAHAYTKGSDIHVASGQEKHLPHEAWHVAQQKQGRVQPTMRMKGVSINDDPGLEKEADVMGGKAVQMKMDAQASPKSVRKEPGSETPSASSLESLPFQFAGRSSMVQPPHRVQHLSGVGPRPKQASQLKAAVNTPKRPSPQVIQFGKRERKKRQRARQIDAHGRRQRFKKQLKEAADPLKKAEELEKKHQGDALAMANLKNAWADTQNGAFRTQRARFKDELSASLDPYEHAKGLQETHKEDGWALSNLENAWSDTIGESFRARQGQHVPVGQAVPGGQPPAPQVANYDGEPGNLRVLGHEAVGDHAVNHAEIQKAIQELKRERRSGKKNIHSKLLALHKRIRVAKDDETEEAAKASFNNYFGSKKEGGYYHDMMSTNVTNAKLMAKLQGKGYEFEHDDNTLQTTVSKNGVPVYRLHAGMTAFDPENDPAPGGRQMFTKKGSPGKQYVADDYGVPTGRYAYTVRSGYHMGQFIRGQTLTGKYAQHLNLRRPSHYEALRLKLLNQATVPNKDLPVPAGPPHNVRDLTDSELLFFHQAYGSGPSQRGISASRSAKPLLSNEAGGFAHGDRFARKIRLDLGQVPLKGQNETPMLVNWHHGIAGVGNPVAAPKQRFLEYEAGDISSINKVQYSANYSQKHLQWSTGKNRELYLRHIAPEFLADPEHPLTGTDKLPRVEKDKKDATT